MHKSLFEISDYCELNCWYSCSCFSDKFEYVNLLIIELLMMKLHVHDMYKWVYCELYSNGWIVLGCCWFVTEYMFNWCCCCYEMLFLMIHTLGIHNFGFVVWIELLLRVFVKMGWFDKLCWNDTWFHVWCVFESLWKRIWVLGDQNLDFGMKNGSNPWRNCAVLMTVRLSALQAYNHC